jgi:5,10-methylenetetrahydromethanopterin reductase
MINLGLMIGSRDPQHGGSADFPFPGGFADIVAQAQWAEEHGFAGVWVGESRLTVNAIVPITLIAAHTKRIKVCSGIMPYRTRNAALIAVTAKTLDDLAPGRIRLGLGGWWEPLATQVGLANHKPLRAMREVVTVVRELLAGNEVTYRGEFVDLDGIRFDDPSDDFGKSYPVEVHIGAVRKGMCALAGEIADGVLLDFLVPPSYNDYALDAVRKGAAKSGRSLDGFQVPQLIGFSANDDDPQSAIDDCKELLTQYIAQQPHIAEFCGADEDLIAQIKSIVGWPTTKAQVHEAMKLVSNELTQDVAACGTATQAIDRISAWVDHGCTEPVLTPLGSDPMGSLVTLAEKANLQKAGTS